MIHRFLAVTNNTSTRYAPLAAMLLANLWSIAAGFAEESDDLVAASGRFVVRSDQGGPSAKQVLGDALDLTGRIQRDCFGEGDSPVELPACLIVLHSSRGSYATTVGPSSAQTSGRSLIKNHGGEITRRIDLLVDSDGKAPALAHELTHILLSSRFGMGKLPRWADEGLALMFDSSEKQRRHERDLRFALRNGTAIRIGDLVRLDRITSQEQMAAFYGQSHSLARYLIERDSAVRFIAFLERRIDYGDDRALRELYGINSLAELEQRWREHVDRTIPSARTVGYPGEPSTGE